MKNALAIIFLLLNSFACSQNDEDNSNFQLSSDYGYFVDVYDHSKEMLNFMKEQELQGGGPTWMALLTAAFQLESPSTIKLINFDDEADAVRVSSNDKNQIIKVNEFVEKLKSDKKFMLKCISQARKGGYIE